MSIKQQRITIPVDQSIHTLLVMMAGLHKTSLLGITDKILKLGLMILLSDDASGRALIRKQRRTLEQAENLIDELREKLELMEVEDAV